MWYRQAQFNKQAASIGMYVESIAKNMARMFMRELRKEFLSHKNNYVSFYMLIDMNTAIDMMQVEDRKKSQLKKFFKKCESVYIFLKNDRNSINKTDMVSSHAMFKRNSGQITINLYVRSNVREEVVTSLYQEVYEKTVDSLRHEIQHYIQIPKTRLSNLKNFGKNWKKWMEEHEKEVMEKYVPSYVSRTRYYLNEIEVDAFVTAWYQQSKYKRVPFSEYLQTHINKYIKNTIRKEIEIESEQKFRDYEISRRLTPEEIALITEEYAEKIRKKYLAHAYKKYGYK